jgi:hypothetical protein
MVITFNSFSHSSTFNIGFPAVFVGSQSSLAFENLGSIKTFSNKSSWTLIHNLQAEQ